MRKEDIISAIKYLKHAKPHRWKADCRELLKELAKLDDPYGEHEYHGTELLHRTRLPGRAPEFDRMDDNSGPEDYEYSQ